MAAHVDWGYIRPLYVAGGLSNREIVRQYAEAHKDQDEWKTTISEAAIRKHATAKGWKKTLADRIKREAKEKLVRGEFAAANQDTYPSQEAEDDAIVEAAAESIAGILKLHRADIAKLKQLEHDIIKRLNDDEDQIVIGWYQGEPTEHIIKLGIGDRSRAVATLSSIMDRRIKLERVAWGIDETNGDPDAGKPAAIEVYQEF